MATRRGAYRFGNNVDLMSLASESGHEFQIFHQFYFGKASKLFKHGAANKDGLIAVGNTRDARPEVRGLSDDFQCPGMCIVRKIKGSTNKERVLQCLSDELKGVLWQVGVGMEKQKNLACSKFGTMILLFGTSCFRYRFDDRSQNGLQSALFWCSIHKDDLQCWITVGKQVVDQGIDPCLLVVHGDDDAYEVIQ